MTSRTILRNPDHAGHSWVFWFLNRHVGEKIASPSQYEESIKKVGGFASVRFLPHP